MSRGYACILIAGILILLSVAVANGSAGQKDEASERYARRANAAEGAGGSGVTRNRSRSVRVRHARTPAIAGRNHQSIFVTRATGRRQGGSINRYREPNPFHERNHENPLAQRVRDNPLQQHNDRRIDQQHHDPRR